MIRIDGYQIKSNSYFSNNMLSGELPSFLQNEPNYLFIARNNQFSCPLPKWCGPYPGNGDCAPCTTTAVSPGPVNCCSYHLTADCSSFAHRTCSVSACPEIPDLHLCESNPMSSCLNCSGQLEDGNKVSIPAKIPIQ